MNVRPPAAPWYPRGRGCPLQLRLALWSGGVLLVCNLTALLFITMFSPEFAFDASRQMQSRPRFHLPVGLTAAAVLGGAGTYWLSRKASQRMRLLSRAADSTSADTLGARLELNGPADEIKELADAFDAMLGRLRDAFERQGQFMGDVAHELRTPLATLRTNLEVVAADSGATLADYREMTEVAERALTRLDLLVEDLLLLATEDQLPAAAAQVELSALLANVLRELEPEATERKVGLLLSGDGSVAVRGDRDLLARAFINLIQNGIRYNEVGGQVEVTVSSDGAWAIVTVSDTGIGMSDAEQARAFDRFYRADTSRVRQKGGAGLGLSIVAKIVRQHGGDVSVRSAPSTGATFTLLLPL